MSVLASKHISAPHTRLLVKAVVDQDFVAAKSALAAGADPSFRYPLGYSLLMLAANTASFDLFSLLLKAGADPRALTETADSALTCALSTRSASLNDSYKMVSLLLKEAAPTDRLAIVNERHGTILHYAINFQHGIKMCNLLVKNGAPINSTDANGGTILHLLAQSGHHSEMLSFFIKLGAPLNARLHDHAFASSGGTALQAAVLSGNNQGVKQLLEAGADPNLSNNNCESALHLAAINGSSETINLLLVHGADISVKGKMGITAEDYASAADNLKAYNLLRQAREGAQLEKAVPESKSEHRPRI
jgi:ankyrin repeat protein